MKRRPESCFTGFGITGESWRRLTRLDSR